MRGDAAVVIGIGNPFRRDDGVGPAVLALLEGRVPPDVRLVPSDGETARLIEQWRDARTAVVVDAARGAGPPGTVHTVVVRPGDRAAPGPSSRPSSHRQGLADALALAAVLGAAPQRVVVHAVEVGSITQGVGLSPAVRRAAGLVAGTVLAELTARHRTKPSAPGDVRH